VNVEFGGYAFDGAQLAPIFQHGGPRALGGSMTGS